MQALRCSSVWLLSMMFRKCQMQWTPIASQTFLKNCSRGLLRGGLQGPVPLQLLPEGHKRLGAHQVCGVPRLRPVPAVLRGRRGGVAPPRPPHLPRRGGAVLPAQPPGLGGGPSDSLDQATGLLTAAAAAARSLCDQSSAAAVLLSCVIQFSISSCSMTTCAFL